MLEQLNAWLIEVLVLLLLVLTPVTADQLLDQNILGQTNQPTADQQATNTAIVTRVIDGDTIELSTGQKVRYIGIDTPDTFGGTECFGPEAKKSTSHWC